MQPVIIDIRGGIAEVYQKPLGVEVVLRDFDGDSKCPKIETWASGEEVLR